MARTTTAATLPQLVPSAATTPVAAMLPQLVLLPGMDGTAWLFKAFSEAAAPVASRIVAIGYPRDRSLGYDELLPWVLERLPQEGDFLLVAESFSGPLGVRLAALRPQGLVGIVLVASFVRPPLPVPAWCSSCLAFLCPLAGRLLFRRPPPGPALRLALLGWDADAEEVQSVHAAIATVEAAVLARRAAEILRVDVQQALLEAGTPVLYVQASKDRLVSDSAARTVQRLRPDAKLAIVHGPHLILQRAPEASVKAIRDWYEGLVQDQ